MKFLTVIAAVALLSSAPALGQAPAGKSAAAAPAFAPAEKPAAAPVAPAAKPAETPAVAPVAKPAEKPAEKPERKVSRARDTRDARACLELATNKEVIVCAQKYL